MDEYDCVVKSSLKFKGEKRKKKHGERKSKDKPSHSEQTGEGSSVQSERAEDAEYHGGWWKVDSYGQIKQEVAIEFLPGCYVRALSSGRIVLGNPHPPGEGPDEEEIFTAIAASTNQVAFKSGFGRYLCVDTRKRLMGLSEAIGEMETFLPVFEDDRLALCAYNDCFLAPDEDDESQQILARSEKAGAYEMLTIRVNHDPQKYCTGQGDKSVAQEDTGTLYETEMNYLKKYHGKGSEQLNVRDHKKELKRARLEGELHEALLDKRVKHKSDKYCK